MITFIQGDATNPISEGQKIIVHICNDIGAWGRGFVLALSKKWKKPELEYRRWYREKKPIPFELGKVQFVSVEDGIWVANLIGQRDIVAKDNIPPIRYDAIKKGLTRVAEFAHASKASVHMPRIGCGLAGGNWENIGEIVQQTLAAKGIKVFVYDL